MLVLSRKKGEKISIGGGITIEISRILKGRVLLGITAPKDVPINREEVLTTNNGGQNEDQRKTVNTPNSA